MYTYYILFAAWLTPSPPSQFEWVKIYFFGFTVLFTIVIFNILIAILSDEWSTLTDKNQTDDNRDILDMLIEVIEMRVWIYKNLCCCANKTRDKNILNHLENMYVVFREEKKGTIEKSDDPYEVVYDETTTLHEKCLQVQTKMNDTIGLTLAKFKLFYTSFDNQFAFSTDTVASNDTVCFRFDQNGPAKQIKGTKDSNPQKAKDDMQLDINNMYEIINESIDKMKIFSDLSDNIADCHKKFEEENKKITSLEKEKIQGFKTQIDEVSNIIFNIA